MLAGIIKKIMVASLTVAGSVTLVFFLLHMIPGDPVENLLGDRALDIDRDRLRHSLHLDMPLYGQYFAFWRDVLSGTLGHSFYREGITVASMIKERFPYTLHLSVLAMILAVCAALPLGVVAAKRKGGFIDSASMIFAMAGASLPTFFLGPLLLLLFCKRLGWMPPPAAAEGLIALVLPVATLGLGMAAILSRLTRASMIETLSQDYITAARARGLPEWKVVTKHALRNALIPVVTVMGMQFGAALSGAIITEKVFAWPGMGTLLIEAIEKRDYPVVQGCILIISVCYVVVNLSTDVICAVIDPRIRRGTHGE